MVPLESVLDLIGNTPLVDVSNLSANPRVKLMAKLENQNPFGSVKDRVAKAMIEAAIKDGALVSGQRIMDRQETPALHCAMLESKAPITT